MEIRDVILAFAQNSRKSKFYFKDIEKAVQEKFPGTKMREVKKAATQLVNEGILIYFSTGSSTLYGLKGRGIDPDAEEE